MQNFNKRTAVITGAASGLGLAMARIAAAEGMRVVMADVQADALDAATAEIAALGADLLPFRLDVSVAAEVEALAAATRARFGVPHLLINNAGVGAGGLVWEMDPADWAWVLGVNLMGVVHGLRAFVPAMLEAAAADPGYQGHIVNTASMAGLVNVPNLGVYNVGKHAVVSLSETLHHDLALVTDRVRTSVLCPFYVPTGIGRSARNRPGGPTAAAPTPSQQIAQAMLDKAVEAGKLGADEVARLAFDAVREQRFYVFSHPQALGAVRERLDGLLQGRNPADPYAARPELGERLRRALRPAG